MKLPRIFSRGMVVQQALPIPVWGWSRPLQRVVVRLGGRSAETQADAKGGWMVRLPKLDARDHLGAALSLHIAADEDVSINEVAVGEVWLCAGYRALPWMAAGGRAGGAAGSPPLRLFSIAQATAKRPLDDAASDAGWQDCTPRALDPFAALAAAFAGSQQAASGVPHGLILARSGGEAAEAWVGRAALASEHQLRGLLERAEQAGADGSEQAPSQRKLLRSWQEAALHQDPGNRGVRRGWHKPDCDDSDWRALQLPGRWSGAGYPGAGALWLRRTVALPAAWKGRALQLSLGAIEDADRTYVQGSLVGASADDAESGSARTYAVPASLVKGRSLAIAVRVFARQRPGGVVGAPDDLRLAPGAAPATAAAKRLRPAAIALDGEWKCRAELELPRRDLLPPPPLHDRHPEVPAALNNGMIQPLVPYGLRGAVWLPGPPGRYKPEQYQALVAALVRDWRTSWGQGAFPLAIVQLPGACPPELREAQASACSAAGAGLVAASDVGAGESPGGVDEAGRRLALWARAAIHGEGFSGHGPVVASCSADGAELRLRFTGGDDLRTGDGGTLRGFAIAGADRRFVPASARIDGDAVVLSASGVAAAQAVRYGWAELPDGNLCNRAGLPAAPFRCAAGTPGGS